MPTYIIHKDGAYNLYTTVADGPYFTRGITLTELKEYVRQEQGNDGLRYLDERLERAHETGCSSFGLTLEECVSCNRAGPREANVPLEKFIAKFLSPPPQPAQAGPAAQSAEGSS